MKVNVCLIQDNPIFFDKETTVKKVEELVIKYGREGSKLIAFPESFN
jgi:nitrilase